MKFTYYIKLILAFIVIAPQFAMASINHTPYFFEGQALTMLFNNYDDIHRISIWEDMKFPTKEDKKFFWRKTTGIVSSVLFQAYKEDGKEKVFLLTKTIPVGIPFGCHACLPLLSAAVFVYGKAHWYVESKDLFLMYEGEYGISPKTKLVSMENNKHGVLLEFEYRGDGVIRKKIFLMPKGKKINVLSRI